MISFQSPPIDLAGYNPVKTAGDGHWYDAESGNRAVEFIETYCCHVKGHLAGQPFMLEEWQSNIVRTMFGWKNEDGTRRYRVSYIEIPRKNGKSILVAAIALYMLFCDGEPGAEIYSAASDRDQASLVFNMSASMIRKTPELAKRSKILDSVKRIVFEESFFRAIPTDVGGSHGYNAHAVFADELHAWDRHGHEFWEVLDTSTGARLQPLMVAITTAGYDRHSVCWEQHEYARRVRDGEMDDAAFLPVLYFADEDEDWTDRETWKKANPNFGISVTEQYLTRKCKRAKDSPVYENSFRRLHLNQWVEQDVRWLQMDKWRASSSIPKTAGYYEAWCEELRGCECYGGLDLSTSVDLTCFALVFNHDKRIKILPTFWVPEERIEERVHRDKVPYDVWLRQGWLRTTPGESLEYDYVRKDINQLEEMYNIEEIAADRWNAHQIITQLEGDGFEMVEFGQGYASMSSPTKELERLLLCGMIDHGNHPVLTWCAGNVTVEQDAAGNIKPSKKKSTERIDGIVAAIMGLARLNVAEEYEPMYTGEGSFTL